MSRALSAPHGERTSSHPALSSIFYRDCTADSGNSWVY